MAAPTENRFRLRPEQRLRARREFDRIRAEGVRTTCGCLIANWLGLPPGSASRVGVVTSRRIGNAAERSRARRLLRESFRLHQHEFSEPVAIVLVARNSIAGKRRQDVERDLLGALRRGGINVAS